MSRNDIPFIKYLFNCRQIIFSNNQQQLITTILVGSYRDIAYHPLFKLVKHGQFSSLVERHLMLARAINIQLRFGIYYRDFRDKIGSYTSKILIHGFCYICLVSEISSANIQRRNMRCFRSLTQELIYAIPHLIGISSVTVTIVLQVFLLRILDIFFICIIKIFRFGFNCFHSQIIPIIYLFYHIII